MAVCRDSLSATGIWSELNSDHVISDGQVFRCDDSKLEKFLQVRKSEIQDIRKGKPGAVPLAVGAGLRLHCADTPVACSKLILRLNNGKSMLQVLSERVRRIAQLATEPDDPDRVAEGAASSRPSFPIHVMTFRVTRRAVADHHEAHRHFGFPGQVVSLLNQQATPALANKVTPESGLRVHTQPGGKLAISSWG